MQSKRELKQTRRSGKSHVRLVAALAAAVYGGAVVSRAAAQGTWLWTGGGSSSNWSDSGNWSSSPDSGSETPISSRETAVEFAGATDPSPIEDLDSPFSLNNLMFDSGGVGFELSGDDLQLTANAKDGTGATIVQNSSATEQIVEGLTLVFTTTVSGSGSGTLNFLGPITGTGGLIVSSAAPVVLFTSNSYTGGTTLNSGELVLVNNYSLGAAPLTLNGGTITSTSDVTLNNAYSDASATAPVTFQAAPGTTLTLNGMATLGLETLNFGSSTNNGTVSFLSALSAGTSPIINVNGGLLSDGSGYLSLRLPNATLTIAQTATVNLSEDNPTIEDLTGSGSLEMTSTPPSETLTLKAANFSGSISGDANLIAAGSDTNQIGVPNSGNVLLFGINSYAGNTTVSSGALVLGAAGALPTGGNVVNNATLAVEADNVAGNISGSGTLLLTSNATLKISDSTGSDTVGRLTIFASSTLDLTNNKLKIQYGSGFDSVATILSYLTTGYAGGAWTGSGITSSSVAALNLSQSQLVYSIGYADGADGITGVPSGEIQILPTLAGDAKLQGIVAFGDFQVLSQYFGQTGTSWDEGNFTYSNSTDFADFQLLAQNFGQNTFALTSGELASLDNFASQFGETLVANPDGIGFRLVSVPEPSGGLFALAGFGVIGRRRRRAH